MGRAVGVLEKLKDHRIRDTLNESNSGGSIFFVRGYRDALVENCYATGNHEHLSSCYQECYFTESVERMEGMQ